MGSLLSSGWLRKGVQQLERHKARWKLLSIVQDMSDPMMFFLILSKSGVSLLRSTRQRAPSEMPGLSCTVGTSLSRRKTSRLAAE
jgi:hypothetical protein